MMDWFEIIIGTVFILLGLHHMLSAIFDRLDGKPVRNFSTFIVGGLTFILMGMISILSEC